MTNSDAGGVSTNQLCVSKVPFFNHLDEKEMREIVDLSMHKHYQKCDVIHRGKETLDDLHIVHKGRVKIYYLYASGKEQLIRILEPGEMMGELALFTEKIDDSYAEAIEQADICTIQRRDMQRLMQHYPSIAMKILEQFSNRLDQTEKLAGQLSAKDAEGRIAHYLIDQSTQQQNTNITLPMSKKDLASHLGTTQETLSRRLSQFQTNGWIEQKGQRAITVIDSDALEMICAE